MKAALARQNAIIDIYIAPNPELFSEDVEACNALKYALKARREKELSDHEELYDIRGRLTDSELAINRLLGRKEPGKVTDGRLKRTDSILMKRRNEPVSFSEMGKLQEWSKETRRQNMTHLGHLYEQLPDRYEVRESKLGGKTVRLVPLYYKHITIGGL